MEGQANVKPISRLAIAAASAYLRLTPVPCGRWRLLRRFLPELRKNGHQLGERLVNTRYGFKFNADLGDWLGQYVYLTGVYEPPTARVIAELLDQGETFIDVGANSGFFTLLASRRVGPAGRVLSFEPVPSMYKRLLENISTNGMNNVSVQNVALSNAEGSLPMFEGPEGHKGISSLRQIDNSSATLEVRTLPLDSFASTLSPIKLIKIDVEGAEQLVLEGMTKLLSMNHPYLVIEITDNYLRAFGHGARHLANFISEFGYRMYKIGAEGLILMNPEQAADDDQFNALFAYAPVPDRLLAP